MHITRKSSRSIKLTLFTILAGFFAILIPRPAAASGWITSVFAAGASSLLQVGAGTVSFVFEVFLYIVQYFMGLLLSFAGFILSFF
ncbi:MAG: hypothetical protein AAB601_02520, partial [Patescibacteria group bacterium]